jgi:hypothetical protein
MMWRLASDICQARDIWAAEGEAEAGQPVGAWQVAGQAVGKRLVAGWPVGLSQVAGQPVGAWQVAGQPVVT